MDKLLENLPAMALAYGMVTTGSVVTLLLMQTMLGGKARTAVPVRMPPVLRFNGMEVLLFILLDFVILPAILMTAFDKLGLFAKLNLNTVAEQTRVVLLVKAPLWLALFAVIAPRQSRRTSTVSSVRWGLFGALGMTLPILALHFLALVIFILGGGTEETHPLAQKGAETTAEIVTLLLTACVAAPIMEEMIFRGVLLHWCREKVERSLLVFAMACVFLFLERDVLFLPAWLFLLDAVVLMVLTVNGRKIFKRWPTRSASAILATATLFAVLHASVWPTPWPLLLFGIGLGFMSVRTGRVLPGIVTHALFNLVAVIYLLRGGS